VISEGFVQESYNTVTLLVVAEYALDDDESSV